MAVTRTVIVELWTGALVVQRLGPVDLDAISNSEVLRRLRALGVTPIPDTAEARRARLIAWPTQADQDAIAVAHVAANDGVRPVVRVLETMPTLRPGGVGGASGAAGSPLPAKSVWP